MEQDKIHKLLETQKAKYKAMGLDDATIKSMMAPLETLYKKSNKDKNTFSSTKSEKYDTSFSSTEKLKEDENTISLKQKYLVSCGYILAIMNDEDTLSLAAGDSDSSEMKLSSWWDLNSKQDVLDKIDLVFNKGHRFEFENDSNNKLFIKQVSKIAKDNKLNTPKEIAAWDYCRIIGLCRWAIDVEYFTETEAEKIMTKVAKQIQKTYSSWADMGMAYLLGRAWWAGEENIMDDYGFVNALQAFNSAMYSEDSFWKIVSWNTVL